MRIIYFITIISFSLLLQSCFLDCEKGSGELTSKTTQLKDFYAINLSGSGQVKLIKSTDNKVEIETDDNLIDNIETYVRGGELFLDTKKCILKSTKLNYTVYYSNIEEINISGSGSIFSDEMIDSKKLELKVSGSGKIQVKVNCKQIISKISGSGEIQILGKSNYLKSNISGSGDFQGFKLECKDADIKISGSGLSEVSVYNHLKAKISGSGDIYVKGQPTIDSKENGSGNIISVK